MGRINHPNLSERLRSLIRAMIVNGDLPPDSRVNEVRLAKRLDVSRTPLREALTALVGEGALASIPRRGFFVRPLTTEELRHIYPIRALLDPEALRLSGLPSSVRIANLRRLNDRMKREPEIERRVLLDDQWHLELLAGCPNPVLLDLIRQFMLRTRRYELAFYRETRNLESSISHHRRIIAALRRHDLDGAVAALETNMKSGIDPILSWLETRAGSTPPGPARRTA